jgi:hypothetical protein
VYTAVGFYQRAHAWIAELGITIEIVQTDNGACYYKAFAFRDEVEATGARHHRLPPRRPAWNGKAERSTAPSSRNGSTCASTDQTLTGPPRLRTGCTSTTITDTTPLSAAHP